MSRPLSDASRAELAALHSSEWVISYRRSLPRSVWEAARAEDVAAGADAAASSFPFDGTRATKPRVDGDVLRFTSVHGRAQEVPLDAIRSIQVDSDHVRGALEGAGWGLLAGAALGAVIGFTQGDDPPLPRNSDCGPCSFTAGAKSLFGAIAGGVVGFGVGLIVGALVGHEDVIELTPVGR